MDTSRLQDHSSVPAKAGIHLSLHRGEVDAKHRVRVLKAGAGASKGPLHTGTSHPGPIAP